MFAYVQTTFREGGRRRDAQTLCLSPASLKGALSKRVRSNPFCVFGGTYLTGGAVTPVERLYRRLPPPVEGKNREKKPPKPFSAVGPGPGYAPLEAIKTCGPRGVRPAETGSSSAADPIQSDLHRARRPLTENNDRYYYYYKH